MPIGDDSFLLAFWYDDDFDAAFGALSPNAKHQIDRGCVGLYRLCQTCGGGMTTFQIKQKRQFAYRGHVRTKSASSSAGKEHRLFSS